MTTADSRTVAIAQNIYSVLFPYRQATRLVATAAAVSAGLDPEIPHEQADSSADEARNYSFTSLT